MKHHFLSVMIAFSVMVLFFACSKQEDPPAVNNQIFNVQKFSGSPEERPRIIFEDGRTGTYYGLFYKKSLSIDSVTVDHINRSQIVFNKFYVDSVFMNLVPNTPAVQINGVKHGVYNVKIKFINGQFHDIGNFWSIKEGTPIVFKPSGQSLLPQTNKNFFVRVFKTQNSITYSDFYFGIQKVKFQYQISGPIFNPGFDFISSNYESGTVFVFPHE